MIDLNDIKRKGNNSGQLACRVDEDTKTFVDSFCKSKGISMSSLLTALIKAFKTEQEQKMRREARQQLATLTDNNT